MGFLLLTEFFNLIPNLCLGKAIWTFFVFLMNKTDYHYLLGYIRKILLFTLKGIKNTQFLEFSKKEICLSIFSQLFSKKELKTIKNNSKLPKQICDFSKTITISCIIIVLLFLINISFFDKLYKRKQQLSLLKGVTKFLKNPNNYPIVPLMWLNDNEIIFNVGLGCESESIDQGRSYVDKNIDISNCFFSRSSSYSGDGGVIYVYGGSYSMNINYSMFYNCIANNGGAILFLSINSYLRMICANSCSCGASNHYHFAYLGASLDNHLEYLTVSKCSHTKSGYESIWIQSGNQRVNNTNSSMNLAYQTSGICIETNYQFSSSHCTFSNNNVIDGICIWIGYSGKLQSANIVHNDSPSRYGVVRYGGTSRMYYCVLHSNENILFSRYSGSLEIAHCFISHTGMTSTGTNNSLVKIITYQIQFFKSFYCNAELPVPVPSPIRSVEDTMRMTLGRTSYQTMRETHILTP